MLVVIKKHHPPLPPVLAHAEYFKLALLPGMKGMGYHKELWLRKGTGCG